MKTGIFKTEIDMGIFGRQNIEVIFEEGEIEKILWDDVDVLHHFSDEQLDSIYEEFKQDLNHEAMFAHALVNKWKGQ